jgi:CheY-like chemotaxis protein
MARVLALVPDLLFGSRLAGALRAAGEDVELLADEAALRARMRERPPAPGDVLIVDLTDPDLEGSALLEALRDRGELNGLRTLAFYSHVEAATRERAERAGFDLVVPRSRIAREGAELLARLAGPG